MGLVREQYVPFWCLVGLLMLMRYVYASLIAVSKANEKAGMATKKQAVSRRWCLGKLNLKRWKETGQKSSDLEAALMQDAPCSDEMPAALPPAAFVSTAAMERVCTQHKIAGGIETASLAVLLALKQRRTYGSATLARLTEKGAKKVVDVALVRPTMSFVELLAAVEQQRRSQEVAAAVDSEGESPDAVFAWAREPFEAPGYWFVKFVDAGKLSVHAPVLGDEQGFCLLFEACAAAPDSDIWNAALMSEATKSKVKSWGAPPKNFAKYRDNSGRLRPFPVLFADLLVGDKDAIAGPGFQLSYNELRRRVAAVARAVAFAAKARISSGKEVSDSIIIYMGRGEAIAPSFFGVMQAGYGIVPIDLHWPAERSRTVAVDSNAWLALTEESAELAWHSMSMDITNLVVNDALYEQHQSSLELVAEMSEHKPAITLFTSGSTGKPKGIVLSHGYVLTLAAGRADSLCMSSDTRTLLHQSPTWMPFIDYLFGPMLVGGCCVFVPEQKQNHAVTPANLRAYAREHDVTILGFVPPVLDIFLDEELPTKLRCICVGGAAVPAELCQRTVEAFQKRGDGDHGFLATGYHGTEQGDVTQIQIRSDADVQQLRNIKGFMTSGRPHTTQRCAVLDQELRLVAPGGIGEICVAGPGLAAGYLNLPEKTLETFLPSCEELGGERTMKTSDLGRWTSSGSLEVVGRSDSMVKVRGARIELGEVEAVVGSHPEVRASVVAVHKDRLVAYVVPAVPGDLREHCKTRLASYMVPHVFQGLENLPQLSNGKVNKKALPPPSEESADGSETIMELDSLGQMRKLTRMSASEDFVLDNVRAILMLIVIQSHATPLSGNSMQIRDLAHVQMQPANWSYMSYVLFNLSRSGGWSALAYLSGFDDTRSASKWSLTYREALFLAIWIISGFKWTLWFLPAFVWMRILFVVAHKLGMLPFHVILLGQIWLTVPMFVDWYTGWTPRMTSQPTQCSPDCFCPFEGRPWVESLTYYTLGMWSVPATMIDHSFVGRALFFIPCYWLGFFSGRDFVAFLVRLKDEFSMSKRFIVSGISFAVYVLFIQMGGPIEKGFNDSCPAFWLSSMAVFTQLARNVAFYTMNLITSALYVIVIAAVVPIHLKYLAKVIFVAYVLASFAPVFCLVDLPTMTLQIRDIFPAELSPLIETLWVFGQPAVFALAVGSFGMWVVQTLVRSVRYAVQGGRSFVAMLGAAAKSA
eukprot:TRINITY_DN7549_c0_g3_i2.p1 TRINITY_DN7549_c0_g3~~TRINITY_DN7549_c0_g3_i2.p1  ORF type:complete len:1208 (+),score=229.97 TRINITY_DN7549_c0_g3_i2:234-3857(+)